MTDKQAKELLSMAVKAFKKHPSATNWRKLTDVMELYQASYFKGV